MTWASTIFFEILKFIFNNLFLYKTKLFCQYYTISTEFIGCLVTKGCSMSKLKGINPNPHMQDRRWH